MSRLFGIIAVEFIFFSLNSSIFIFLLLIFVPIIRKFYGLKVMKISNIFSIFSFFILIIYISLNFFEITHLFQIFEVMLKAKNFFLANSY